jgi:hypothetical protein
MQGFSHSDAESGKSFKAFRFGRDYSEPGVAQVNHNLLTVAGHSACRIGWVGFPVVRPRFCGAVAASVALGRALRASLGI